MEQLKLNSTESREIAKQVMTADPYLIQDYVNETNPAKKQILSDRITDAFRVAKNSLDKIKDRGIVAGTVDPFDQSKYIDKNFKSTNHNPTINVTI